MAGVSNGGHTRTSILERHCNIYLFVIGDQNADFEMAAELWGFLSTKSR